jgi:hypothetical protein
MKITSQRNQSYLTPPDTLASLDLASSARVASPYVFGIAYLHTCHIYAHTITLSRRYNFREKNSAKGSVKKNLLRNENSWITRVGTIILMGPLWYVGGQELRSRDCVTCVGVMIMSPTK